MKSPLADGTKLAGYVTAEENQLPRQCSNCIWYKADKCHHPVVILDPDVPGKDGKPKPVHSDDCCNFFRSPSKVLIYGLRHGTTELNAENKFRGWANVELDATGRDDADKAAEFLFQKGVIKIVASDLNRAQDTAKAVADLCGVEVETDIRLRPWDVGMLSGQDKDEYMSVIEHALDNPDDPLPGGESLNEFADRFLQALEQYIAQAREDGPILLVFHTSNVIQLENYCAGDGADGRPESTESVLPGGIVAVTERDGELESEPIFRDDGEGEYGS